MVVSDPQEGDRMQDLPTSGSGFDILASRDNISSEMSSKVHRTPLNATPGRRTMKIQGVEKVKSDPQGDNGAGDLLIIDGDRVRNELGKEVDLTQIANMIGHWR